MGFLSSLFDFGDKPTTTSGGQTMTPVIPEMLKPNVQEVVDASQILYRQRLGEGYKPYTGQTIAGFSPEEVAAQEGLKSLVGTQAPLQQEAINMARGQAREFTPEIAQQYMSPYLRTALDAQKAQAQRQYESVKQPQFEADAVAAGGMSGLGSRAAVQAAEMDSNQQRLLADIEAVGQQKAFEAAEQSFRDQTSRERTAGQDLLKGSADAFAGGVKEQGLLTAIGEQKRDLSQSALDEAYLKYVTEQQFPEQQLARYQSSIYGNPLLAQPSYNKTTTGTQAGGGPGLGKTLLGMAGTAASIYAMSDEQAKTDITPIGINDSTGLREYAYRYKGDPKSYPKVVGPMAQDVEKKYPEAVGEVNGFKTVSMDMLQNNGIAGTPEGQEYIERSAAMGGRVMPPVMYRQQAGPVMPTGAVTRDEVGNIVAPTLVNAKKQQDFDTKYASNIKKGGETPYGLSGLDSATDESAFAQPLAAPPVAPDVASDVAQSKTGEEREADIGISKNKITGMYDVSVAAITKSVKNQFEANANVSKEQVANLAKEANAFEMRSRKRFDKYESLAKDLIGDDPNAEALFWFTVSAAIMKPGNAFANMAQGFKEATIAANASREKKNKLLMQLSKDEMEFEKDVDKLRYKSTIAGINLTAKQERELNKYPQAARDAIIKAMKAGESFNLATAQFNKTKAGKKDKAAIYNAIRKAVKENRNWVFNEQNGTIKVSGKTLQANSPEFKEVEIRVREALKAYKAGGGDMLAAQKIIEQLTGKSLAKSQDNSSSASTAISGFTSSITGQAIPQAAINLLIASQTTNEKAATTQAFNQKYGAGSAASIITEDSEPQ
jgi:hypothetical protein